MPTILTQENHGSLHRVITGIHTFDWAFRNDLNQIGFPIKAMCEIYGPSGIGKSTTMYWLATKIAEDLGGNIVFADLETLDQQYLVRLLNCAGFNHALTFAEGEGDADILDDLLRLLKKDEYKVGIIDSVGAINPTAEAESSSEAANMGRRAKIMAQYSRKYIKVSRDKETPIMLLFSNHVLPLITLGHGMVTSGGQVKDYLSGTAFRLSRKGEEDDGSYLLQGTVTKNRFGPKDRIFWLFSLAGFGIHPGLTAVKECIALKICDASKTIKLEGKSYGYFKAMLKRADDADLFKPFIEALDKHNYTITKKESKDDDDEA